MSTKPSRVLLLACAGMAGAFTWSVKPEAAQAQAQIVIEVGEEPPPRIETYPHYYYDDRDVYWAHGHWYYRHAGHWYYYRHEPPPLHHHRVVAYERHPHRYVHEGYREERPVYYHQHHHHHHHEQRSHHERHRRDL